MKPIELTIEIAFAVARDAGNRNMRKNGRTIWNEEDYDAATEMFEMLWSPVAKAA